jgi:hypothetical protein
VALWVTLALSGCAGRVKPARATGVAAVALAHPDFVWDSLKGPRATTYFRRGKVHTDEVGEAADLRERQQLAQTQVERAVQRALALTGESTFTPHLRVFHVPSRNDMQKITRLAVTGLADPDAHAVVVMAHDTWSPFHAHEIMHVVSIALWGHAGGASEADAIAWERMTWLREGLAVAAEDRCAGYGVRGIAAAMLERGMQLRLTALTTHFSLQDDFAAYLQSGAFVHFLLEQGGSGAMRNLWKSGELERVYRTSPDALYAAYTAWLQQTPAAERPPDPAALKRMGCGASG